MQNPRIEERYQKQNGGEKRTGQSTLPTDNCIGHVVKPPESPAPPRPIKSLLSHRPPPTQTKPFPQQKILSPCFTACPGFEPSISWFITASLRMAEPSKTFGHQIVTLTALLKQVAVEFPSRPALIVSGKFELTHARLQELVDEAATRLISSGVRHGDVVALTFKNTVEFVIMFRAVIRARAVAAPLNPTYTEEEFEFYLTDSEAKLLLTSREGNAGAQVAADKLNIRRATAELVLNSDSTPASISLSSTSPSPSFDFSGDPFAGIPNEINDVALFLHTSGTTSRPKGVPLTQLNLAASVQNIRTVYKLSPSDCTVIVLPLFHVHGLLAGLLSSLAAGAAVVLPASGRFSASTFWADVTAYGVTWYTAVPTIHQILLDRHDTKPEQTYPRLRFIRSCSAALAPAVLERLEEVFGAPVLEAYAMTEATHLMASNPLPENGVHKPGSVGKPVGQEMAILDVKGVVQEANYEGEICVRGLNVTSGYKNNPDANEAAFQFGWFHTGDIGYLDSDGYLHLVGRIKELINRGGEKISPIEVDAVLLAHPDVGQAISFGVPNDKYGEEIYCAIIPKKGVIFDPEEVLDFCKKNLASFKVPKKIFITDDLPKTTSGKIQRRLMTDHLLDKISAAKFRKT